jgi:hypothetical protein
MTKAKVRMDLYRGFLPDAVSSREEELAAG